MTSANLNFTERLRIEREHFDMALAERSPPRLHVRRIDLSGLDLEKHWPIRLEGRTRDWLHRKELGTVGKPHTGTLDLPPDTFVGGRLPRWRLLVVDVDDPYRRIAAMAEGIRLGTEEAARHGRNSLLPVEPADLGQLPWRLVVDDDGFTLQVNERLPAPGDFPARPDVAPWLLPAVLREILLRIRIEEDAGIDDGVRRQWLDFATSLAGPPPEDPAEDGADWCDWVDQVVRSFAARHELVNALLSAFGKED